MKKVFFAVCILLSVCLISSSCTADNSKQTILCEKIAVDMLPDGSFDVTAIYRTDSEQENFVEKNFVCSDVNSFVERLLSVHENAMYTPLEHLLIGKSVDLDSAVGLVSTIMNSSKFNLKCRVIECENAKFQIYNEPDEQSSFSFPHYYRIKANQPRE